MMRKMINNSRGEIDKAGLVPRVQGKDELEALKIRRHWLEKVTDQELDELGYADHHASLITTNIEHAIGHVQVPVGAQPFRMCFEKL